MSQEALKELQSGIAKLSETHGSFVQKMMDLSEEAAKDGALPRKMKKLIFVALAVNQNCHHCIAHHVHDALKAGATSEEILEVCQVAAVMGGGPNLALTATAVQEAIAAFSS